jgi:hypothetical protein
MVVLDRQRRHSKRRASTEHGSSSRRLFYIPNGCIICRTNSQASDATSELRRDGNAIHRDHSGPQSAYFLIILCRPMLLCAWYRVHESYTGETRDSTTAEHFANCDALPRSLVKIYQDIRCSTLSSNEKSLTQTW